MCMHAALQRDIQHLQPHHHDRPDRCPFLSSVLLCQHCLMMSLCCMPDFLNAADMLKMMTGGRCTSDSKYQLRDTCEVIPAAPSHNIAAAQPG